METVEEFLARGGKIEKIPQGESGELRFNAPLRERISRQKKRSWNKRTERLHNKAKD